MVHIDTVLFDFDGTIMDTTNVIMQSWQEVYRRVTGRQGDESVILKTFGGVLADTLGEAFPGEPVDKLVKIYRNYHHEHFLELIDLYPGILDMLGEVKKKGTKTALVTSRLGKTTMMAVEEFGLHSFFDCIVTADDCTKHKPDPEPLTIALTKMDSKPATSIMIGDTLYDRECARRAGTKCALVDWAPSIDVKSLTGADQPEYILYKAADLLEII